jgi:hypothetical protein
MEGSNHTTLLYIVQRAPEHPKRNISMGGIEIFYFEASFARRGWRGSLRSPGLGVRGWGLGLCF